MNFPLWVQAGFWGGVAGSALIIGALIGYFSHLPQRLIAGIMAFGGGVLISAISLELMNEAFDSGGFASTSIGFIGGAAVYSLANFFLTRKGGKHRKRSAFLTKKSDGDSNGMAIAIGSLLDGIPESIAIGLSMIGGGTVSLVTIVAIFLSNIPEGLSSSSGMRKAGRSAKYIFGLWILICLASVISSIVGLTIFSQFPPNIISATTASAAGAILAMLADTMMPEAFESTHNFTGLITVAGFLCSFLLSKLSV